LASRLTEVSVSCPQNLSIDFQDGKGNTNSQNQGLTSKSLTIISGGDCEIPLKGDTHPFFVTKPALKRNLIDTAFGVFQ